MKESFAEYNASFGFEASRLGTVLGTALGKTSGGTSKKSLTKEKDSYSKILSVLRIEKEFNGSKL